MFDRRAGHPCGFSPPGRAADMSAAGRQAAELTMENTVAGTFEPTSSYRLFDVLARTFR